MEEVGADGKGGRGWWPWGRCWDWSSSLLAGMLLRYLLASACACSRVALLRAASVCKASDSAGHRARSLLTEESPGTDVARERSTFVAALWGIAFMPHFTSVRNLMWESGCRVPCLGKVAKKDAKVEGLRGPYMKIAFPKVLWKWGLWLSYCCNTILHYEPFENTF